MNKKVGRNFISQLWSSYEPTGTSDVLQLKWRVLSKKKKNEMFRKSAKVESAFDYHRVALAISGLLTSISVPPPANSIPTEKVTTVSRIEWGRRQMNVDYSAAA